MTTYRISNDVFNYLVTYVHFDTNICLISFKLNECETMHLV